MSVTFICPQCGTSMTLPAPISIKCPRCKTAMVQQSKAPSKGNVSNDTVMSPTSSVQMTAPLPSSESTSNPSDTSMQEEAERILLNARKEASAIKEQADALLKKAEKEAQELLLKAEAELKERLQSSDDRQPTTQEQPVEETTPEGISTAASSSIGVNALLCALSVATAIVARNHPPALILASITALVALFTALVPLCKHH